MMLPLMGIESINACDMAFASVQQKGDSLFSEQTLLIDLQASERFTALLEEGHALTKEALGVCERLILRAETLQQPTSHPTASLDEPEAFPLSQQAKPTLSRPTNSLTSPLMQPLAEMVREESPTEMLVEVKSQVPQASPLERPTSAHVQLPIKDAVQVGGERPMRPAVVSAEHTPHTVLLLQHKEPGMTPERVVSFDTTPPQSNRQVTSLDISHAASNEQNPIPLRPFSNLQQGRTTPSLIEQTPTLSQTHVKETPPTTVTMPLAEVVILAPQIMPDVYEHTKGAPRLEIEQPVEATPNPISPTYSPIALPVEQATKFEQVESPVVEHPIEPKPTVVPSVTIAASPRPTVPTHAPTALPIEQETQFEQVESPVAEHSIESKPIVAPSVTIVASPRPTVPTHAPVALPTEHIVDPAHTTLPSVEPVVLTLSSEDTRPMTSEAPLQPQRGEPGSALSAFPIVETQPLSTRDGATPIVTSGHFTEQANPAPSQPLSVETRMSQQEVSFSHSLTPDSPVKSVVVETALPLSQAVLVVQAHGVEQAERGVPMALPQGVAQQVVRGGELDERMQEPLQVIAPTMLPITLPHQKVELVAQPIPAHEVAQHFVLAAQAVADAMLVSAGFVRGEGQLLVRLRPEVLNGSEIRLVVTGGTLTVIVNPATQDIQTLVEANRTQFEQYLAEKVQSWRLAVSVKRGGNDDERL